MYYTGVSDGSAMTGAGPIKIFRMQGRTLWNQAGYTWGFIKKCLNSCEDGLHFEPTFPIAQSLAKSLIRLDDWKYDDYTTLMFTAETVEGRARRQKNRYILECLKTHIVWHKCDFLAQNKQQSEHTKKHDFFILLLKSGQNRDVLFVCDFSEVLINKPGKKTTQKSQTIRLRLTRCVSACVCVSLLSSLQSEDEQWWASVGKWLSERGHQKKSNTLAFFLCSQMALQRADFPSSHFQPAFCRSSKLRPQIQIANRVFLFFLLVLQHAVNFKNGLSWKVYEFYYGFPGVHGF